MYTSTLSRHIQGAFQCSQKHVNVLFFDCSEQAMGKSQDVAFIAENVSSLLYCMLIVSDNDNSNPIYKQV